MIDQTTNLRGTALTTTVHQGKTFPVRQHIGPSRQYLTIGLNNWDSTARIILRISEPKKATWAICIDDYYHIQLYLQPQRYYNPFTTDEDDDSSEIYHIYDSPTNPHLPTSPASVDSTDSTGNHYGPSIYDGDGGVEGIFYV
jgi:hypothetical protein